MKRDDESTPEVKEEHALLELENTDLLKFGMIPEFIGRVPVVAPLNPLDEKALIQILTMPKNALVKQFTHLLEIDDVDLKFSEDAVSAIAQKALERKTGARGLRAIIEECMLEVMFEVPSKPEIKEVVITRETITDKKQPIVVMGNEEEEEESTTALAS